MSHFPSEIWLQIFSSLSYWDLKVRIPAVCRSFKSIIDVNFSSSYLDEILLRHRIPKDNPIPEDKEETRDGNDDDITAHIAFQMVKSKGSIKSLDELVFYKYEPIHVELDGGSPPIEVLTRSKMIPFRISSCLGDNATTPPVNRIKIYVHHNWLSINGCGCSIDEIKSSDETKAITVQQVMEKMVELLVRAQSYNSSTEGLVTFGFKYEWSGVRVHYGPEESTPAHFHFFWS